MSCVSKCTDSWTSHKWCFLHDNFVSSSWVRPTRESFFSRLRSSCFIGTCTSIFHSGEWIFHCELCRISQNFQYFLNGRIPGGALKFVCPGCVCVWRPSVIIGLRFNLFVFPKPAHSHLLKISIYICDAGVERFVMVWVVRLAIRLLGTNVSLLRVTYEWRFLANRWFGTNRNLLCGADKSWATPSFTWVIRWKGVPLHKTLEFQWESVHLVNTFSWLPMT